MSARQLLLLGVLSFCGGLLASAPAPTLYGWLKGKQPAAELELLGLHGTLLEGALSSVQINGRPALTDLNWHLHPLPLLLARAGFHVDGGGKLLVDGDVSVSALGKLRLRDFRATGTLKPLLAAIGQPLPVDGQMRVDLQKLDLKKNLPQGGEGLLQIQGLQWTLARDPLALGDYQATISTSGEDTLVSIESTSGPIELKGDAKLAQDQSYEFNLRFKSRPGADPMLINLLGSAGQPDAQGYYTLKRQGTLAP